MNYFNPNRGPSGSPNPQKNSVGCIVAAAFMIFFGLIVVLSALDCTGFGAGFAFFPILIIIPVIVIIVAVIKSANNQSPQGGPPQPHGRSPYHYAARPTTPPGTRQPAAPRYAPQPPRPPVKYDSHLCDDDVHTPESPGKERAALNQLQAGYGTQAARKDRKQPSRAYDINNHNEGMKALVDAGLMTWEEYETMSRR